MNAPIYTVIENTTDSLQIVPWAVESGSLYVKPGATAVVEGDIWSVMASKPRKRLAFLAACKSSIFKFTVKVRQNGGEYVSVPLFPIDNVSHSAGNTISVEPPPVCSIEPANEPRAEAQQKAAAVAVSALDAYMEDNARNNVVAHTAGSDAVARHFGIGLAEDVEAEGGSVTVTGASDDTVKADSGLAVESGSVLAEAASEDTVTVEAAKAPETAESGSSVEDAFNALTSDKKWNEAYELLVATFGKDRVTFTPKSIMSLKTFDNVNRKYRLTEE